MAATPLRWRSFDTRRATLRLPFASWGLNIAIYHHQPGRSPMRESLIDNRPWANTRTNSVITRFLRSFALSIEIEVNKTTCATNHICDEKQPESLPVSYSLHSENLGQGDVPEQLKNQRHKKNCYDYKPDDESHANLLALDFGVSNYSASSRTTCCASVSSVGLGFYESLSPCLNERCRFIINGPADRVLALVGGSFLPCACNSLEARWNAT